MNNLYIYTIIVILSLLSSCKKEHHKEDNKAVPVTVCSIQADSILKRQNYTGVIEESAAALLSFQVPGNISDIYVKENQLIHKGQILARLNTQILQNNYNAAASVLSQAEDVYKRMHSLHEKQSLPEIKWVEVQSSLKQAQAMESIAKKNLQNTSLFAPYSGIISNRLVEPGMNISAGIPVFRITNIDSIKIKIAIPENEIAKLVIGQKCEIEVPALNSSKKSSGYISEKSIIANPLSRTYDAKIILNEQMQDLLPGMICNVDILQDSYSSLIILPITTIQVNGKETFVWSVEDNKAIKKEIILGELHKDGIVIKDGLKKGDVVVLDGYQKISNGTKLIIR